MNRGGSARASGALRGRLRDHTSSHVGGLSRPPAKVNVNAALEHHYILMSCPGGVVKRRRFGSIVPLVRRSRVN